MTLYLDTSALIKVYLNEVGGQLVRRAVVSDQVAWTCVIAYLEARSGFARALRERRISPADHARAAAHLESDWDSYAIVPVDLPLVRQASDLVDLHTRHGLRALDALQLAAALQVAAGEPGAVTLVCFDRRLWRSARDEGFECLPRAQP